MSYIPKNARWYLAEMIEEIAVESDPRNIVHLNVVLVGADSAVAAFDRAQELGKQSEATYKNPAGKTVLIRFRGLRSLEVIHDELEHGAELAYSELIAVPEDEIAKLITPREQLGVFRPITPSQGPDYRSREVLEEAVKLTHQDLDAQ